MKSPYFFLFACILSEETTFTLTYYPFFTFLLQNSNTKCQLTLRQGPPPPIGEAVGQSVRHLSGGGVGLVNGLEGCTSYIIFN